MCANRDTTRSASTTDELGDPPVRDCDSMWSRTAATLLVSRASSLCLDEASERGRGVTQGQGGDGLGFPNDPLRRPKSAQQVSRGCDEHARTACFAPYVPILSSGFCAPVVAGVKLSVVNPEHAVQEVQLFN